jgi:type II secretory pathway component PulF
MDWLLVSWPMLILLGVGLRMALRLTYGARGPEPDDPIHVFLNVCSWVLIGMGIAPAVLGGIVTFFGVIIILLAAATLIEAVVQRRVAQRRSFCTLLSLLVERGAQIEPSLLMAGQSMGGIVGRAARRMFQALNNGLPLPAAVARNRAALPAEASAYLASGRARNAQAAALRELSRGEGGETAGMWRALVDRLAYLTSVLLIMVAVLTFIMIKIVPEFEMIFSEFSLSLPAMTQLALQISYLFTTYLAVPVFGLLFLTAFATIVLAICYLCDVPALKWLGDWLFRARRTADVLRILAIATEQRQPLPDVLHRVALVYPSVGIRRRLLGAAEKTSAGADWRDALRQTGVITYVEGSLLHTAERVGNLPWALRVLAQRREKRAVYMLAMVLQVLYPMAIVMLGAIVGFYVIALFVPLVDLIAGMS